MRSKKKRRGRDSGEMLWSEINKGKERTQREEKSEEECEVVTEEREKDNLMH